MSNTSETAILAGGCFWGMQDLIRKLEGVENTRVGYIGGRNDNPTYHDHPGHAEAIEVRFDPNLIRFRRILEVFFQIHDPTTVDRQGNDVGTSYRSEIFYTSEAQKTEAESIIVEANASGVWPGPIVTRLSPAPIFWEAEDYHQDYLVRMPNGYTCHYPRPDWVLPKV